MSSGVSFMICDLAEAVGGGDGRMRDQTLNQCWLENTLLTT